jgi:hypothetical protein
MKNQAFSLLIVLCMTSIFANATNNCLTFNGSNYVSLGNFGAVNSWTIECWFNSADVVNYRNLFHTNYPLSGASNLGVRVEQYSTNAMSVVVSGTDPIVGMTILPDGTIFANQWHHLAIVGNKTTNMLYAYVDGVLKSSMACTNWPTSFDNFDIGRGFGAGREFVGALDKVNVWNYALSSTEVNLNMDKTIVGNESGLISSYNFNQSSGTTLTDIKGAHNGTLVSNPSWQQVANNTLNFDGVDDYVTIADNNTLDVTQMTIEAWVKWNPATATDIQFVCAKGLEQMEIHTGVTANKLRFIPTTGVYLDVPNCLPVNQWTHIACVYNPSAAFAAIYINGVLTTYTNNSSAPLTTAIANTATAFSIGQRYDGTYKYKGNIDELKVWNTVRTQTQILVDMSVVATGSESGLAAYYNFDQGAVGSNNTAITTLYDRSSNSNNGTLTNFTKTGATSNFVSSTISCTPTLAACGVTSISQTSVSVSSDITSTGWNNPTVRGVCYATTSAPTISSSKVETTGSYSTGAFTTNITGLTLGTVYYARAYATNTNGTSYGPETSFTLSIATNALAFDGTDDVVTIPDAANLNPGTQNWSIEFWFNSADANTPNAQHIFNKESLYEAKVSGGYLTYALMPAWDWRGGNSFAVSPNTWYHCAIVYDHSNIYLYKNGVLVNTEAKTGDMGTTAFPLLFAYRSLGGLPEYRYNGKIDEFRLWNTARSACEIATNYNVGITGTETNLVAYYKFNEASGTTLTDLAGGDNNGTLSSFNGTATSGWVVSNAALTNNNTVAVSTTGSSAVAQTTATISGNITNGTATESGVAYSTSHCPVISGTKAIQTVASGTFSASLTGLETSTIYYARAYATNASGTSYGAEINFTTSAAIIPTIDATTTVTAITSTTAASGGNVSSTGGAIVTARGVCWGTISNPELGVSNFTTNSTGTGSFTSSISGLTAGTTYYVRSYATNSVGTGYGTQISFTTLASYAISASRNDNSMGTVSGAGNYDAGATVSLTAVANSGYRFINWTESVTPVSASATLSFTAAASRTLVANFASTTVTLGGGETAISTLTNCANCDVVVPTGQLLTVDASKTLKSLTIESGGKATNNQGGTITLTNFTINSNATNGTGTYLDDGTTTVTGTVHVNQYLTAGRNWYVATPVSNATSGAFSTAGSVIYYDEPTAGWVTKSSGVLNPMQGYISVSTASTGNIVFSGDLNNGNQSINLTRTPGAVKEGFNLVGNPYPSYVSWDDATKTNLEPTMWFRTKNASAYIFDTYNATSGIGTNNNQSGALTTYIPPMQAFWVKVMTGKTSGNLSFSNAMRSHANGLTGKLKAPAMNNASEHQVIRLLVSNGINSDEAIVLFNPNASNGYDGFDSPKMNNATASIPEIYTLAGTEQVVINGLKSVATNPEVALGFSTGQSNTFSIKATQISNFAAGTQLILRDNVLHTDWDLTLSNYSFTSEVTSNDSRFTLLFKVPSETTGWSGEQYDMSIQVYKNMNHQIVLKYNGLMSDQIMAHVYNVLGEELTIKQITSDITVLGSGYFAGAYMVKVTKDGKSSTRKVIID